MSAALGMLLLGDHADRCEGGPFVAVCASLFPGTLQLKRGRMAKVQ
jgi:hypothetical protein